MHVLREISSTIKQSVGSSTVVKTVSGHFRNQKIKLIVNHGIKP